MDNLTIKQRRHCMSRIGNKDTDIELTLRSALHTAGLRYRLHRKIEGIKVDIVFTKQRVAIFVDGCFWHGCPIHATYPKTNEEYWLPKLAKNKERDKRQTKHLEEAGWKVVRLWEHEIKENIDRCVTRIKEALC